MNLHLIEEKDVVRELEALGFEEVGETETTTVWKDKKGNTRSLLKEVQICPAFLKEMQIQKIQARHHPHPVLFEQAYTVAEKAEAKY